MLLELGMVLEEATFVLLCSLEKCVLINIGKLTPFSDVYENSNSTYLNRSEIGYRILD